MRQPLLIALFLMIFATSDRADAGDPMALGFSAAPAAHSVAAIELDDVAIHQYFYIDFPRQLQSLQNEIELAEAELELIARRVASYRPFRSFGTYAATYMADQSWQVALLAAEHRLECLRLDQADLWRRHRLIAEAVIAR